MKLTSLKKVQTMAAVIKLDISDLFRWGLRDEKYWGEGLSQAICSYTEGWDYWYDGIGREAMSYYKQDMLNLLAKRGLDTTPLQEESGYFDADLYEVFKQDVTRAYADALRDAEQSEFHRLVSDDVLDRIEKVGAPYYTLLKLDRYWDAESKKIRIRGFVEVENLYEAERVLFGFTRQWHKDTVASTTTYGGVGFTYDPDEIEQWADEAVSEVTNTIDHDYRMQECADDETVAMFFTDYNEIEHLLKKRQEHWAWAARVTQRMMQPQPTPDMT